MQSQKIYRALRYILRPRKITQCFAQFVHVCPGIRSLAATRRLFFASLCNISLFLITPPKHNLLSRHWLRNQYCPRFFLSSSPSTYPVSPSSTHSPVTASHSFARNSSNRHHRQPLDESCTRTVTIVVNRMLALPSSSSTITTPTATPDETPKQKFASFYIWDLLRHFMMNLTWVNFNGLLVTDDTTLCRAAFDSECLEYLAALI